MVQTTERMQSAIIELQSLIRAHYPETAFDVVHGFGDDPSGTYILATVDIDDTDHVYDLIVDRLVDLQVDEDIPIHVLPLRPLRREAQVTANLEHPALTAPAGISS